LAKRDTSEGLSEEEQIRFFQAETELEEKSTAYEREARKFDKKCVDFESRQREIEKIQDQRRRLKRKIAELEREKTFNSLGYNAVQLDGEGAARYGINQVIGDDAEFTQAAADDPSTEFAEALEAVVRDERSVFMPLNPTGDDLSEDETRKMVFNALFDLERYAQELVRDPRESQLGNSLAKEVAERDNGAYPNWPIVPFVAKAKLPQPPSLFTEPQLFDAAVDAIIPDHAVAAELPKPEQKSKRDGFKHSSLSGLPPLAPVARRPSTAARSSFGDQSTPLPAITTKKTTPDPADDDTVTVTKVAVEEHVGDPLGRAEVRKVAGGFSVTQPPVVVEPSPSVKKDAGQTRVASPEVRRDDTSSESEDESSIAEDLVEDDQASTSDETAAPTEAEVAALDDMIAAINVSQFLDDAAKAKPTAASEELQRILNKMFEDAKKQGQAMARKKMAEEEAREAKERPKKPTAAKSSKTLDNEAIWRFARYIYALHMREKGAVKNDKGYCNIMNRGTSTVAHENDILIVTQAKSGARPLILHCQRGAVKILELGANGKPTLTASLDDAKQQAAFSGIINQICAVRGINDVNRDAILATGSTLQPTPPKAKPTDKRVQFKPTPPPTKAARSSDEMLARRPGTGARPTTTLTTSSRTTELSSSTTLVPSPPKTARPPTRAKAEPTKLSEVETDPSAKHKTGAKKKPKDSSSRTTY
jgi:hypothetical protein